MMTSVPRKMVQIVPSLLAADLARLGQSLQAARRAGVEWVSVDVMDGHFVPNLSFGPDFVRMAKRQEGLLVDAHLMIDNPAAMIAPFAAAGADFITIHWEACADAAEIRRLAREIRGAGAKAGLAVKPKTPVKPLLGLLDEIDLALIMTVEPGFGGAKFIEDMLPKIRAARKAIDERGLDCWLQVDGGINLATVAQAAAAGADSLVAGTAVFGAEDIASAVKSLRERAQMSFDKRIVV